MSAAYLRGKQHSAMLAFMTSVIPELRKAMERSGSTRYALAKETGLSQSALSRFARGGTITLETAERLASALGFRLALAKTKGGR